MTEVDTPPIENLCLAGVVPVLPSLAEDEDDEGQLLNVNADTAAAAVAQALEAEKLVFLTDTPGILRDRNEPDSLIRGLTPDECRDLIAAGRDRQGDDPQGRGLPDQPRGRGPQDPHHRRPAPPLAAAGDLHRHRDRHRDRPEGEARANGPEAADRSSTGALDSQIEPRTINAPRGRWTMNQNSILILPCVHLRHRRINRCSFYRLPRPLFGSYHLVPSRESEFRRDDRPVRPIRDPQLSPIPGLPGPATDKILFSEHHLSHAASTFLCSPFDEAAILTVDGVGEWACATFGRGRGNEVSLLREIRFPHSVGLLYSAFTAFLGFEVNEGEYKVMGMAPVRRAASTSTRSEKLYKIERDGSLWLDMSYFCFHHSTTRTFNQKFVDLFGEPRDPDWLFFTERRASRPTSATSRPTSTASPSATSTTPTSPPAFSSAPRRSSWRWRARCTTRPA